MGKKATPTQALPLRILKQGWQRQGGEQMLSPSAGYTGGCPSAVERPTGPVFWQSKRVRVYAGTG